MPDDRRPIGLALAGGRPEGAIYEIGALRALATEGIQRGHMRMHARNVAMQAGAGEAEVHAVVSALCEAQDWSVDRARDVLHTLRGGPPGHGDAGKAPGGP